MGCSTGESGDEYNCDGGLGKTESDFAASRYGCAMGVSPVEMLWFASLPRLSNRPAKTCHSPFLRGRLSLYNRSVTIRVRHFVSLRGSNRG